MCIENKPKICFVPPIQFVPTDVWSSGHFVPLDVLSFQTLYLFAITVEGGPRK
jgi:hypothetical protein